jgi:type I restriction enzyme S subunit
MTTPSDWPVVELGELLSFSNGVNAGKAAYGRGTPFANVLEVINNESLAAGDIPGRVSLPPSVLDRYRVRRGDVLLNRTSETQDEVGLTSVYVDDEPVVFGGFVFRGRPITERLDLDYSKYALRAPAVRRQIISRGQGGIRANVGQRDLKSVLVPVPAEAEQRAIAEALDEISDYIRALKLLIEKKQAVSIGLRRELVAGLSRLPGHDSSWTKRDLASLGSFHKGRGVRRDDVRSLGVPCIRYGELYTAFRDYTANAVSFVDEAVAALAFPLRSGDILFAGSGETKEEIGTCVAYVGPGPAVAGGDQIILRGEGFDAVYLATLLNTPKHAATKARAGQGDAVVHISARALAAMVVDLPPIEEQRAIAKVIRTSDTELLHLRQRLAKASQLKRGMAAQLLSGCVRLPIAEVSA